MLIKKEEKMMNKKKKKGFTLIELIVVIAILGILAAIAIPRFNNIRQQSIVKADAATATQIVNACRVQETDTNTQVVGLTGAAPALQSTYMVAGSAQSFATGKDFTLSGGKDASYVIKWTPHTGVAALDKEQTVTEGQAFTLAP